MDHFVFANSIWSLTNFFASLQRFFLVDVVRFGLFRVSWRVRDLAMISLRRVVALSLNHPLSGSDEVGACSLADVIISSEKLV